MPASASLARSLERKARNDGQYDDCLRRTDPRVIRVEQSNPARYARAELTRCLPDAGPRCTLR